jgi:hypothetical protein
MPAPPPYASDMHDRNDRKYGYISVLLAEMARVTGIDLRNSVQASTYIADHIEWAQFHSTDELRLELKDKFLQLMSGLVADADKSEVYAAMVAAISRLTYDYNTFKNNTNNPQRDVYRKWALNAVHTGHKEWLNSEVEQLIDNESFIQQLDDQLCYAYGAHDSNEFKYARLSLLLSNVANNNSTKKEQHGIVPLHLQGRPPSLLLSECNQYIAWARFRSVKEIREDLLDKIQDLFRKLSSDDSMVNVYSKLTKVILDLTDKYDHDNNNLRSYNDNSKKYSDNSYHYQFQLSTTANKEKKNYNNNKEEMIMQLSKLIDNDHFLIPMGLRS